MPDVLDISDVVEHFRALEEAAEVADFSPVLREQVHPMLLASFRDRFTSSASADGAAWPARKDPGDGHPLLMETGALMQAATGGGAGAFAEIETRELSAGVDMQGGSEGGIPGAGVHQFGYAERNIPARPYLEADDETLVEIGEVLADDFEHRVIME